MGRARVRAKNVCIVCIFSERKKMSPEFHLCSAYSAY